MALVPLSFSLRYQLHHAVDKLLSFVGLDTQGFSPEESMMAGPTLDARLQARVPMSNANIDTLVLNQLSSMGMKRGKQVTDASHPELMAAWRIMSARAGLKEPPQLIIAESDVLNALTFSKQEVAITTGLLKVLDLRETCAVLGHELGHAQSNHMAPRVLATGALAGGGLLLGNRIGHHGGIRAALKDHGIQFKWLDWLYEKTSFARVKREGHATSLLGYALYMGIGSTAGSVVANHFTVRPTELDADAKGAVISGDPLGLASALGKLESHASRNSVRGTINWLLSGYPSAQTRIAKLKSLAERMPENGPLVEPLAPGPADVPMATTPIEPLPPSAPPAPPIAVHAAPVSTLHSVASSERVGTPVVTAPAVS